MTQENDYTLLRPFDLEAAKRGEAMVSNTNDLPRFYVAGPDEIGKVCFDVNSGILDLMHQSQLRMAPLAWVEGKPVYKGDVLYYKDDGETSTADSIRSNGKLVVRVPNMGLCSEETGTLTWTPPKPTTKQVKLLAWRSIYGPFCLYEEGSSYEKTVQGAPEVWKRVPSEDKTIEVEE